MGKTVAFIRHGEALHNPHLQAAKKETDEAKKAALFAAGFAFLDPELTPKGRAQAAELRERLVAEGRAFDLVVVSPLTRVLQTASIALAGLAPKFLVEPRSTESALPEWGLPQRGRTAAQLRDALPFLAGPEWDLALMDDATLWTEDRPGEWVHPKPAEERLDDLIAWLGSLPEPRVCVVGHSGVFERILGIFPANCQLIEKEI